MPLLELQQVSVEKKDRTILDLKNVDISIAKGDKIGIIGSNGSGKTTMIRVILNLINYKGTVHRHIQTKDVGIQMQHNQFSDLMKVKEIISLVCNCSLADSRIQEGLQRFNLQRLVDKRLSYLSGGEKQRLTIFLVIFHNPSLLIFDEITSGLDFDSRNSIIKLIQSLTSDKTLLIVSHYFEEIEKLADKLLILDDGKLLAFDTIENLCATHQFFSAISIDRDLSFEHSLLRFVETDSQKIFMTKNQEEEEKVMEKLRHDNIPFTYKPKDIKTLYTYIRQQTEREIV